MPRPPKQKKWAATSGLDDYVALSRAIATLEACRKDLLRRMTPALISALQQGAKVVVDDETGDTDAMCALTLRRKALKTLPTATVEAFLPHEIPLRRSNATLVFNTAYVDDQGVLECLSRLAEEGTTGLPMDLVKAGEPKTVATPETVDVLLGKDRAVVESLLPMIADIHLTLPDAPSVDLRAVSTLLDAVAHKYDHAPLADAGEP